MKFRDLAILLLAAQLASISFIFIKITAPFIEPFTLVEARVLLAGMALLGFAIIAKRKLIFRGKLRHFLILGITNCALPLTLVSLAELYITASLTAILSSTIPLCSAAVGAIWFKDRLSPKRIFGLGLGLTGVIIAVGWSPITVTPSLLLGCGIGMLAVLSCSLSSFYVKSALKDSTPLSLALGQQFGAGLVLLPLASTSLPSIMPSPTVIFAVVFLGLFSTALLTLLVFGLNSRIGPVKAGSVSYLSPGCGLIWSSILLGEPIGLGTVIGLVVTLSSLLIITEVQIKPIWSAILKSGVKTAPKSPAKEVKALSSASNRLR